MAKVTKSLHASSEISDENKILTGELAIGDVIDGLTVEWVGFNKKGVEAAVVDKDGKRDVLFWDHKSVEVEGQRAKSLESPEEQSVLPDSKTK